jgi:hypothetical protein
LTTTNQQVEDNLFLCNCTKFIQGPGLLWLDGCQFSNF